MLAEGRTIHVAGQIGWNADCVFESDDFVDQVRQALANLVAVLGVAGAGPEHIVSMIWYFTDKREYLTNLKGVGEAYRAVIGKHFPAMTAVEVKGLMEDSRQGGNSGRRGAAGSGRFSNWPPLGVDEAPPPACGGGGNEGGGSY